MKIKIYAILAIILWIQDLVINILAENSINLKNAEFLESVKREHTHKHPFKWGQLWFSTLNPFFLNWFYFKI